MMVQIDDFPRAAGYGQHAAATLFVRTFQHNGHVVNGVAGGLGQEQFLIRQKMINRGHGLRVDHGHGLAQAGQSQGKRRFAAQTVAVGIQMRRQEKSFSPVDDVQGAFEFLNVRRIFFNLLFNHGLLDFSLAFNVV